MEVVIKIPDEAYEQLKSKPTLDNIAESIIANGKPLPKGHGRLIEANNFSTSCGIRAIDCPGNCDKCSDCVVKYEDIRRAKTIVEADRG